MFKKISLAILVLLLLLLAVVAFLFTPMGNTILKPYIQEKINQFSPLPMELAKFKLGFSSFDIHLQGADSLSIQLIGEYSIFTQSIEALLDVDVKDLSYATNVVQIPLKGAFVLQAKASGNRELLTVTGESNIANSQTQFTAQLRSFQPSSLLATIKQARLDTLLEMIGRPAYAKALLNFELKAHSDEMGNLIGDSEFNVKDGAISTKLIARDFGITAPAMNFNIRLLGKLIPDDFSHNLKFESNIGTITSIGVTDIKKLTTELNYIVALKELAPLAPLTKIPLRGSFETQGIVKGGEELLNIEGATNIADSKSNYAFALTKLAPSFMHIDVKGLKLEKLLYMLYKPQYISGNLNLNAVFKDFASGISGEALLEIPAATTHKEPIEKDFGIAMPATKLSLASNLHLERGAGVLKSEFNSSLATLSAPNTTLALSPTPRVHAPYEVSILDLSKLAFVTKQQLRGNLKANGKVQYDANGIFADFFSKTLGGEVQGNMNNNDITAEIKGVNFSDLLNMLNYPVVFTSKADGTLKYNLTDKRGIFHMNATQGKFLENQLVRRLHSFFSVDLTKELYNNITLDSRINGGKIHSDLLMKSQNSEIKSQDALIDIDNSRIDAILKAIIRNHEASIKLRGALTSPNISIDANKLIEDKAKKLIEKHAPDNIKEPVKNLLKGLF